MEDEGRITACQDCGNVARGSDLVPIEEVRHLFQRVAPGEIFPAGECRKCGALAQLFNPAKEGTA